VPSIGSAESRLITIRGNSGSGKSALAAGIRSARPRGIAIVGQDQLRREILHVRDRPDGLAVGYIDLSARYALDHGLHVVVEGLLHEEIYGDMLRQLIKDHRGITRCYRYQIPFDETLDRHQTKPNAASFGEEEMRCWWRDSDPLHGVTEEIIGPESSLAVSVERVLRDCGWDNRG
jgi:hypothetical protein